MARSYHHGNLRSTLVEVGIGLIEEKGVKALTLREIGERSGVSRTAAYRHFSDKAALLAAISEVGFTKFADALEGARSAAKGSFASRMDAMGLAYLKFAEEHRAYYEVMFGVGCDLGERPASESEAGTRAFGILEDTIREGQATGEIRGGDPAFLAKVVWALSHGVAMLKLEIGADFKGSGDTEKKFIVAAAEVLRTGLQYF
jgi:AcrR family transcriptional regulator